MRPEPLLRFAPFEHTTHVFSVAELAEHAGGVLAADPVLRDVWLRGEIVGVSRSAAGHHYFSLKDSAGTAQLRCVLFRGSAFNSPIAPANGLAIVAHGRLELYARQGSCELVADLLFPEGIGLAQLAGERLYRHLEHEGLFEPSRKRALPGLPRRIGIVSSERGAVIHDLLSVLERRWPLVEVVFLPAPVQGPGAAAALSQAIRRLGQWERRGERLDCLVVARGGGSDEDLAAFNDERVARALFASPVPVISAVGHETNLTLSDLVADVRAATPSAAAELLVPDRLAVQVELAQTRGRLQQGFANRIQAERRQLSTADTRLRRAGVARLRDARAALGTAHGRLLAVSPLATLARGYAIVTTPTGTIVRAAEEVSPGEHLHVRLHHGHLESTVDAIESEG